MAKMVPIKKDTWYVCVKGIYNANGEKEVPMATMDDDQCTNEGIEELAKFIRGHLAEISENAQKEFERIYTKTTGKKMYGGFKD